MKKIEDKIKQVIKTEKEQKVVLEIMYEAYHLGVKHGESRVKDWAHRQVDNIFDIMQGNG